jgi:hypothetical protein
MFCTWKIRATCFQWFLNERKYYLGEKILNICENYIIDIQWSVLLVEKNLKKPKRGGDVGRTYS